LASDALRFTDYGFATSFGAHPTRVTRVRAPSGFDAFAYQAILNEDVDGDPRAYGPTSKGAVGSVNGPHDKLGNATNDENGNPTFDSTGANTWLWVGLLSKRKGEFLPVGFELDDDLSLRDAQHRFPVKKPAGGADGGFYISTSAIATTELKGEFNQDRYWNAATVPYSALTPALSRVGVRQQDVGLAIRNDTGASVAFFFADWGNKPKVGECSRALFRTFFPRADQEDHPVSFLVFPSSGSLRNIPPNDDGSRAVFDATVRARLGQLSQTPNVQDLVPLLALGASKAAFDRFQDKGVSDAGTGGASRNIAAALQAAGLRFPSPGPIPTPTPAPRPLIF
jgi:hypothetical protein